MENYEDTQTIHSEVRGVEETVDTSRRGFLRSAATAGVASVALAMLTDGITTREAQARLPNSDYITPRDFTIEVRGGGKTVEIASTTPNDPRIWRSTVGGKVTIPIELGSFNHADVLTYAVWYNVIENLQDLPKFSTLVVDYVDANRSILGFTVQPAPGVTEALITIRTFEFHDPVRYR